MGHRRRDARDGTSHAHTYSDTNAYSGPVGHSCSFEDTSAIHHGKPNRSDYCWTHRDGYHFHSCGNPRGESHAKANLQSSCLVADLYRPER